MVKQKIFYIIIAFLFLPNAINGQGYKLVWSDEFEGTTLDIANWTRETGGHGWGNAELQYYTDREVNAFVSNGYLTIKAMAESYGGRNYTSARLKTQTKRFFKYGKIEARIKLPYGQGIWPAFWMLGESITSVGWPACGEIDIMEMIGGGPGRDNRVYGTAHWDNNGHQSYGLNYTLPSGNFSDAFHTFAITWDANKIEWYVDDLKYCTLSITPEYLSELRENSFIILNIAVGGNWPGNPDGTTVFPQTMLVDYVRVYKDTVGLPSLNFITPADSAQYSPGENITLTTQATNSSLIKKVEFYQDQVKIGETNIEPYSIIWRDVQPGCYKIKAVATTFSGQTGESNVVNIRVGNDCVKSPYKGYRQKIPGKIEVENFDNGGAGVAYYDSDPVNSGAMYRPYEGVDIQNTTDVNGGYNIGWTNLGEWMTYAVNVLETADYNFTFRVANNVPSGGSLKVYIDNVDVTGNVLVPYTGGYQVWTNATALFVPLTQGTHELKLYINSGGFNINYISVQKAGTTSFIRLLAPNGGETLPGGSIQEVLWESSGVEIVQLGITTDNGGNWSAINLEFPAVYGSCRFRVPNVNSTQCKVMIIDKQNSAVSATSQNSFSITQTVDTEEDQKNISGFQLFNNYPNPFNPQTKIAYSLAAEGWVRLSVYDMLGCEVKRLVDEWQEAGSHSVDFIADGLSSGMYLYTLSSGNYRKHGTMMLIR